MGKNSHKYYSSKALTKFLEETYAIAFGIGAFHKDQEPTMGQVIEKLRELTKTKDNK